MLIKSKKVKELLKDRGVRSSEKALIAIDEELKKICLKTTDNVLAKKVKTARPEHVPKIESMIGSTDLEN